MTDLRIFDPTRVRAIVEEKDALIAELRAALSRAASAPIPEPVRATREPRQDAKEALDALAAYFRRTGDLWEGPDGCGTEGTDLCAAIASALWRLSRTPMALGLTRIPPFPVAAQVDESPKSHIPPVDETAETHSQGPIVTFTARTPDGAELASWQRDAQGRLVDSEGGDPA